MILEQIWRNYCKSFIVQLKTNYI